MGLDDAVVAHSSIEDEAYLDVKPGAGEEWIVHNLYWGGAVEVYKTNGVNDIKIYPPTGITAEEGGLLGYQFHLTETIYIRIKNVSGSATYIGYDGIQSK